MHENSFLQEYKVNFSCKEIYLLSGSCPLDGAKASKRYRFCQNKQFVSSVRFTYQRFYVWCLLCEVHLLAAFGISLIPATRRRKRVRRQKSPQCGCYVLLWHWPGRERGTAQQSGWMHCARGPVLILRASTVSVCMCTTNSSSCHEK